MTVRASRIALLVTSLLAARPVAGQDSAATRTTAPNQAPPALAPRTVSGRVVRPGRAGMITVGQAWVTLHRVAADSSGPVDSVRTDANGRYSIRYKPVGGDADVLRVEHAIAASRISLRRCHRAMRPATTRRSPSSIRRRRRFAIQTRGRLVVSASSVDGRRTLVEVFELSNDSTVTAVAGARGRATWSAPLAPNGSTTSRSGRATLAPTPCSSVTARVLVYASISPGIRQIAFSYSVPACDFPLRSRWRIGRRVRGARRGPGCHGSGGGLAEQPAVSLEGRNFRRFLAQNVRRAQRSHQCRCAHGAARQSHVVRDGGQCGGRHGARAGLRPTRRRSVRVVVEAQGPDDAAHSRATLRSSMTHSSASRHRATRSATRIASAADELKTRLAAALANEEVPD